jgi:hypothetical protein
VNALRNALEDYYPGALVAFGTDLAHPDAVAVLSIAPTPALGRALSTSRVAAVLKRAGRQRNVERRSHEIIEALRTPQLSQPTLLADAYGITTTSAVKVIEAATTQVKALEAALSEHFEQHPDAKTIHFTDAELRYRRHYHLYLHDRRGRRSPLLRDDLGRDLIWSDVVARIRQLNEPTSVRRQ